MHLKATGVKFTWSDGLTQWRGIRFAGSSGNKSQIENCVIEHASGIHLIAYGQWVEDHGIIDIHGSSPTIIGTTIDNSDANYGIAVDAGSPVIRGNTVRGMKGNGFYFSGASQPSMTGNTIANNAGYGLISSSEYLIDARYNNWGDTTGPLDDSDDRATGGLYNPGGLGNKVSDHVNYYPWIGSPPARTASPTGLAGVPRYTSAKLSWNANSEPTLGGYKIYYGAASGAYGSPIVVDKLTAYKLTGLVNGSPSYIAISSLNSIGAESALSPEISVTPINKFAIDLTVAGSGKGNVLFTQGGTSCNTGCSVLVDPYSNENIQSAASQYSLFKGLMGDLVTAEESVALYMDNDKSITASFDKDLDHNVLIELPTQKYYPSISAAYLDTSVENVLKTWGTDITDNIILNKDIAVTIKGGFNAGYTTNSGITTLHGTLKVRKGKLTVEKLVLQ